MFLAIYCVCPNDRAGNPRRGWLLLAVASPGTKCFVPEGYSGRGALYRHFGLKMGNPSLSSHVCEVTTLEVTPGEYANLARGKV